MADREKMENLTEELAAARRHIAELERSAPERIIGEKSERFRAMFDSVSEAIFVHDCETGTIMDVNRRTLEMYGFTREEALGLNIGSWSSGAPPYTEKEALENIC